MSEESLSVSGSALILVVCTANLCRSPVAEHLVRARVAQLGLTAAVQVSSAGVAARPGTEMDPAAARELRVRGLDPANFRTRVLTAEHVRSAQLVLVASRRHRIAVAELDATAVRRTFTLREMGRIAAALAAESQLRLGSRLGLLELVNHVRHARASYPPARPGEDDLADPFRRGPKTMTDCADLVVAACEPWLALLAGRTGPP